MKPFWKAVWAFIVEISPTFITAWKKARLVYKESKRK